MVDGTVDYSPCFSKQGSLAKTNDGIFPIQGDTLVVVLAEFDGVQYTDQQVDSVKNQFKVTCATGGIYDRYLKIILVETGLESGGGPDSVFADYLTNKNGLRDYLENLRNQYNAHILATSSAGSNTAGFAFADEQFVSIRYEFLEVQLVFIHEVGHILGAHHNDAVQLGPDQWTLMYYYGGSIRQPILSDATALKFIAALGINISGVIPINPQPTTVLDVNNVLFSWTPPHTGNADMYEININDQVYNTSEPFFSITLENGAYSYSIKAICTSNQSSSGWSPVISFTVDSSTEIYELNIPVTFELFQNYPNPFNPSTTISFSLPQSSETKLSIYNMLGEEITTLINSWVNAGQHQISFNASDLSSGVYIYRLSAGKLFQMKKMLLLR